MDRKVTMGCFFMGCFIVSKRRTYFKATRMSDGACFFCWQVIECPTPSCTLRCCTYLFFDKYVVQCMQAGFLVSQRCEIVADTPPPVLHVVRCSPFHWRFLALERTSNCKLYSCHDLVAPTQALTAGNACHRDLLRAYIFEWIIRFVTDVNMFYAPIQNQCRSTGLLVTFNRLLQLPAVYCNAANICLLTSRQCDACKQDCRWNTDVRLSKTLSTSAAFCAINPFALTLSCPRTHF
jgi:hypothetical protein